jgi:hypothetical protein
MVCYFGLTYTWDEHVLLASWGNKTDYSTSVMYKSRDKLIRYNHTTDRLKIKHDEIYERKISFFMLSY